MAIASMKGCERIISSSAERGGIAVEGGLNVRAQHFTHLGQRFAEFLHDGRRAASGPLGIADPPHFSHLILQTRHNPAHPLIGEIEE